jgi:hypothetical protein
MEINLINFTQVCDMAMGSLLRYNRSYVNRDGMIYVIPPSQDFKNYLEKQMTETMKSLFISSAKNLFCRSCLPCNNWRLKHVGKKFQNVIFPHRLMQSCTIEISTPYLDFFDAFYEKWKNCKLEHENGDFLDLMSVISEIHTLSSSKVYDSTYVYDSNSLIDRSTKMPPFVHSELVEAINNATMEK